MIPFCSISSGGIDITGGLSDRLLSIEITDEAEDKSDRVSIELDDREGFDSAFISMPHIGQVVSVVIGYRDGLAVGKGSYLIDDLKVSSPPRKLVVTGRSAAMTKSFRTPRTQSYHQMTVGAILQEVAGRGGYSAAVDPSIAGIVVRHIDQHNESDMAFAVRLAKQHDATAKPVDGKLAVARKGSGQSVSGLAMPAITLTEGDCISWEFGYSAREEAGEAAGADTTDTGGGVRAWWNDIRSGEKKEVTTGSEPFRELRYTFHNEAEAQAAVDSRKNEAARGKASFSCEIVGNPMVQAEAILILAAFRPYIPLMWRIKSCAHRFDNGGYTTQITAELYVEGQEDVSGKVKSTTPTDDDKIDPNAPPEPVEGSDSSSSDNLISAPE